MKLPAIFSSLFPSAKSKAPHPKRGPLGRARKPARLSAEEAELQRKLVQDEEQRLRWQQLQQEQSKLLVHLGFGNSLLAFIVVVICLTLLKITANFSIPIFLGLFIFTMLFPHVERIHERWGMPYGLSCAIVLLLFHLLAGVMLLLISMASFNSLLQSLPVYQGKLSRLLKLLLDAVDKGGIDSSVFTNWDFIGKGISSAKNIFSSLSSVISNFLSSSFIVFLVLLFLLLEGKSFLKTIERSFPPLKSQSIIKIYRSSVEQISFYLGLKTLVSFITGLVIGIGLWLFGVDFPMVWGILAFALNFIPSIGSIIHTLLVGLFSLLQFSENLYFSLAVIAFLLVVQFLIGNYIEPKMQGNRLRLSPVFILLFLYIWGYIWGIAGMLLAVPILSLIKIICQNVPQLQILAYFLENTNFQSIENATKYDNRAQKINELEDL